jgi:imidazolonepropionase-like amidohydrolase
MTSLTFRNASMFDSTTGELLTGMSVRIEDETITAVVQGDLPDNGGASIALDGLTLLPGLIDAHVHVTAIVADFFKLSLMTQSLIAAHTETVLEAMLRRGYTTVRDAGGADSGLVQAIEQGHIVGPRLLIAGQAITQTGGHGDPRPPHFSHGSCICCGSAGLLGYVADGVPEVRRAVREQIRNGAHHIKVMAGGGISTPNDPLDGLQFSTEELGAIVEEADAARTYVMAHAYSPEAISRAVRAGVRSIEHGNLLDEQTAELMARYGVYLVPTLATYAALAERGSALGWAPAMLEKCAQVKDRGLEAIRIAQAAGVKIALGSDLLGDMHDLQCDELVLRQQVMSPAQVLRSATHVNAELIGASGRLGVIAEGACADLLVMDGDPLRDLRAFQHERNLRMVLKAGKPVVDRLTRAPA